MELGMKKVVPGVRIGTEAAVMFHWSKKAEEAFDEEGNYMPWELKKEEEAA